MSATQTATRTGVGQRAPEGEEPYYSQRPNARPRTEEAVPSAEWARWRLYKQRPDIKDRFPESFPDVRQQQYDRLNAEVQADKEKIPKPPRFRKRVLKELKDDYTPKQLGFAPLTDFYEEADQKNARLSRRQRLDSDEEGERIPSLWFERMAQDLFARVWEFCSDTFGLDESLPEENKLTAELHDDDWTARWLANLPKEFVVLASQIARGDMTVVTPKESDPTNWEFLFLDPKSRVKLMVGVMAKILEKNVFNSLLFGAADVEKTALTADDEARSFLDNSYQRNRTRSETVRNYIQANRPPYGLGLVDLWTDNFWDEVDSITMGILDLLLPLINLLGQDLPDVAWPPLKQIHQGLHDIVAEAAWFTNGMRATRSVFWIQFPIPGELNDVSHEHAIDDIWKRSRLNAEAHDKAVWEARRDQALADEKTGEPITRERQQAYEAKNPRPYVRRTAKVQVAMWPFIKRFTPMGEKDVGDGAYNAGETITQIMKAQCVYYYGDDADDIDMKERRTLSEQVKSRRWAKWFSFRALLIYTFILVLFLFLTSPDFREWLNSHSEAGRSSSSSEGILKEEKTTTIVAVPVGTEIVTETVVVTEPMGDEYKSFKSWLLNSKASPSVATVTETVTEKIVEKVVGRADDDSSYYDGDDGSVDGGSDYASTEEGIAASVISAKNKATKSVASVKNKVTEGVASVKDKVTEGMDNIASEFESTTDRLAASVASEKERISSIDSSVRESVRKSVADRESRSSAASQSSADESRSRVAASQSSVSESRKSAEARKSSERERSAASRSSADQSKSSSRSSKQDRRFSSRSSARKSSRSSVAAERSAKAEAEKIAAGKRTAAEEDRIVSEKVAAILAADEAARRTAARITSEEEEKARTSSKKRAQNRKTASKDSDTDAITVDTNVKPPFSVVDGTTGKVAVSEEKKKETVTITVPPDKVVVTVTGPVTQAETKGAVKTAVDKGMLGP